MKVKKQWRYSFYICAIILMLTNTVFLFVNIYDWQIIVSESTILLSVIGCLFAFAAINIYSIFNTNVDTQKEEIVEIKDKYNSLLNKYESFYNIERRQLDIRIIIVRFQTTILAISSTEKMNSQFLEWLDMASNQVGSFVSLFKDLRHSGVSKDTFDSLYCELAIVVNNSIHLLDSQNTIISQDDFWEDHKFESTKQTALNEIGIIRNKMKDFLNYDFENEDVLRYS